jgi:hypothetical protein
MFESLCRYNMTTVISEEMLSLTKLDNSGFVSLNTGMGGHHNQHCSLNKVEDGYLMPSSVISTSIAFLYETRGGTRDGPDSYR